VIAVARAGIPRIARTRVLFVDDEQEQQEEDYRDRTKEDGAA
jgi:hypothetical protein